MEFGEKLCTELTDHASTCESLFVKIDKLVAMGVNDEAPYESFVKEGEKLTAYFIKRAAVAKGMLQSLKPKKEPKAKAKKEAGKPKK